MQIDIPADLEILMKKRLALGDFEDAAQLIRHALEAMDSDEDWSAHERQAVDARIDGALEQVRDGRVYGPDEARRKLAAWRNARLAGVKS